jgi:hypothetical protein
MHTAKLLRRTTSLLATAVVLASSSKALAQTAPPAIPAPPATYPAPPAAPPPAAPPPATVQQQPPPAGNPPPPTAEQQPPPAGYPPPPAGSQPPPAGYPPAQGDPNAGYPPGYGPPPGYSQPPGYGGYPPGGYGPPPPPPHAHDGFFLRLTLGGGFISNAGTDSVGDELVLSAGGPSFGIAAGAAVVPNLILFGTLFAGVATEVEARFNGDRVADPTNAAGIVGFGPGVAYYFMPINVYLSGALAVTGFNAQDIDGNVLYKSNGGVGFQTLVGKEWWVSEDWGIGVAGEFVIAGAMRDQDISDVRWRSTVFSILFSATYN